MADDDKKDTAREALYFDGEDQTKWEAWSFKMLAYADKKGHEEFFTEEFKFGEDKKKWDEEEKANHVLKKAAWSQLALMVTGHALRSVMQVKTKDPKEAWTKLKDEFEPSE